MCVLCVIWNFYLFYFNFVPLDWNICEFISFVFAENCDLIWSQLFWLFFLVPIRLLSIMCFFPCCFVPFFSACWQFTSSLSNNKIMYNKSDTTETHLWGCCLDIVHVLYYIRVSFNIGLILLLLLFLPFLRLLDISCVGRNPFVFVCHFHLSLNFHSFSAFHIVMEWVEWERVKFELLNFQWSDFREIAKLFVLNMAFTSCILPPVQRAANLFRAKIQKRNQQEELKMQKGFDGERSEKKN